MKKYLVDNTVIWFQPGYKSLKTDGDNIEKVAQEIINKLEKYNIEISAKYTNYKYEYIKKGKVDAKSFLATIKKYGFDINDTLQLLDDIANIDNYNKSISLDNLDLQQITNINDGCDDNYKKSESKLNDFVNKSPYAALLVDKTARRDIPRWFSPLWTNLHVELASMLAQYSTRMATLKNSNIQLESQDIKLFSGWATQVIAENNPSGYALLFASEKESKQVFTAICALFPEYPGWKNAAAIIWKGIKDKVNATSISTNQLIKTFPKKLQEPIKLMVSANNGMVGYLKILKNIDGFNTLTVDEQRTIIELKPYIHDNPSILELTAKFMVTARPNNRSEIINIVKTIDRNKQMIAPKSAKAITKLTQEEQLLYWRHLTFPDGPCACDLKDILLHPLYQYIPNISKQNIISLLSARQTESKYFMSTNNQIPVGYKLALKWIFQALETAKDKCTSPQYWQAINDVVEDATQFSCTLRNSDLTANFMTNLGLERLFHNNEFCALPTELKAAALSYLHTFADKPEKLSILIELLEYPQLVFASRDELFNYVNLADSLAESDRFLFLNFITSDYFLLFSSDERRCIFDEIAVLAKTNHFADTISKIQPSLAIKAALQNNDFTSAKELLNVDEVLIAINTNPSTLSNAHTVNSALQNRICLATSIPTELASGDGGIFYYLNEAFAKHKQLGAAIRETGERASIEKNKNAFAPVTYSGSTSLLDEVGIDKTTIIGIMNTNFYICANIPIPSGELDKTLTCIEVAQKEHGVDNKVIRFNDLTLTKAYANSYRIINNTAAGEAVVLAISTHARPNQLSTCDEKSLSIEHLKKLYQLAESRGVRLAIVVSACYGGSLVNSLRKEELAKITSRNPGYQSVQNLQAIYDGLIDVRTSITNYFKQAEELQNVILSTAHGRHTFKKISLSENQILATIAKLFTKVKNASGKLEAGQSLETAVKDRDFIFAKKYKDINKRRNKFDHFRYKVKVSYDNTYIAERNYLDATKQFIKTISNYLIDIEKAQIKLKETSDLLADKSLFAKALKDLKQLLTDPRLTGNAETLTKDDFINLLDAIDALLSKLLMASFSYQINSTTDNPH
ncbi:MAG: hypothetical protein JW841_04350 [Deltaproteobacteria bacterium]|nr:hypothetical protein [Deltaproteobacteria bacterium]